MYRYIDETDRISHEFGHLTRGNLVEASEPPHGGVAWFEPVSEAETVDMRQLRPFRKYPEYHPNPVDPTLVGWVGAPAAESESEEPE